ncbi:MAG: Flp pilus assembly protein CpaB, partial [Bdellovibrionales bacterium]|nr:Flp pilus assembly protein CpaB [Bdellovibrionales bacterium]
MAKRKTKLQSRKNSKGSLLIFFSAIIVAGALILTRQPQKSVNATEVITPVVGQYDTVKIPVPKAPIRAGEKLRDASFVYVSYPTHQLPPNTIRDIGPYLDAVAVAPLPANLPLFQKNVSLSGGASNPVIERIPEGMRAISVRVDATAAVEGWARAGAIVDVFLVKKAGATVVAEKVKILSAER